MKQTQSLATIPVWAGDRLTGKIIGIYLNYLLKGTKMIIIVVEN